jgi:excisionase family DNA binding protein
MEDQHLFNLTAARDKPDALAEIRPNLWLLSPEEVPPILFSPEQVARLLDIGRGRVYDLIREHQLRSVKVGSSRRISARALSDYVRSLELQEPA